DCVREFVDDEAEKELWLEEVRWKEAKRKGHDTREGSIKGRERAGSWKGTHIWPKQGNPRFEFEECEWRSMSWRRLEQRGASAAMDNRTNFRQGGTNLEGGGDVSEDPVVLAELVKTKAPVVVLEEDSDRERGPKISGNNERGSKTGEKRKSSQVKTRRKNCHITGKGGLPERSSLRSKLRSQIENAGGRGSYRQASGLLGFRAWEKSRTTNAL
ncbi:unnamed protein product, partial [Arabidopsis halleri]